MPRSVAQRALRDRRNELRKSFLPRRFSKLGNYTSEQRHLAGAYRVFFNAELENYFEMIARQVANFAEAQWKAGLTCKASTALCSGPHSGLKMPQEISGIVSDGYLDRKFLKELELHRRRINSNNGAKSHNILELMVPLGIDESKIDPILLSECDTLGSGRGLIAHQTGGVAMYVIDPRTEYDQSIKIIGLLDDFELLMELN